MFRGDQTKKDEMDFLCLAEFKKGFFDNQDYEKIVEWFSFIDSCPYGIVCSYCDACLEDYLSQLKDEAKKNDDMWILGRIARPSGSAKNYQTFARVLRNKSYCGPTAS